MKKQRGGVFCKGRVRFYDSQKNKFGFIQVDSSERQSIETDIFFKESALRNSSKVPVDGENIYCFVQEGKKGYYRVSYFYCNNSECDKHGEDNFVYLTHCVNPKCEEIIDSRDSAQCENNWYICAHCLACCSTKKIQNRIKYHTLSNNTYGGPTKGHKEEGKIFCPHCEKLIASGNSLQGYRKMLLKFKSQGTNHPNVIRIGQRKNDNKYWFLLKKLQDTSSAEFDQNVVKLKKLGFNIADTYKPGAETALVSERFSNDDLICSSCSLSISTSMLYRKGNYYRARVILPIFRTIG